MGKILLLFVPQFAFALSLSPTPFPVFLKAGFSTVLEFEETPTKVVLGDGQSFQIEKLDKSLVIKTRATNANTNMFVYFKTKPPRLFVLTASDEVEPTYYRKFEPALPPITKSPPKAVVYKAGAKLLSVQFSPKKDFLTIEVEVSAGPGARISPLWNKVQIAHSKDTISPDKLWSERKEIQKDSRSKARFIFNKPDLPRNRTNTRLVIPIAGLKEPITVSLTGRIQ